MLCAFEHRLEEYAGAPQVAAFGFSSLDDKDQRVSVVKIFDMDCPLHSQAVLHPLFAGIFANKSFSCLLTAFFGSLDDQYQGKPVAVTCQRVLTAVLDFKAASLTEFLETGCLSEAHDPPVLEAKVRDVVWHGDETTAWPFLERKWVPEEVQILLDNESVECSFVGQGVGVENFLSPQFSDFQ